MRSERTYVRCYGFAEVSEGVVAEGCKRLDDLGRLRWRAGKRRNKGLSAMITGASSYQNEHDAEAILRVPGGGNQAILHPPERIQKRFDFRRAAFAMLMLSLSAMEGR